MTDPIEMALSVPEQLFQCFDRPNGYRIEEEWLPRLHRTVGAPWPCAEETTFDEKWAEIKAELGAQGLDLGRYSYGTYSDGDKALARAAWCAVRHLHPAVVVETGVARGVTSRIVLEALDRNGRGRLWSIDLPHPLMPEIHGQTGAAVPESCRARWTYIRGSSRRRLPALLRHVGKVDVFIHDSLHTARNMLFEMDRVWRVLSPGGVMVIDDVYNQAFARFVRVRSVEDSMVCRSFDGRPDAPCPGPECWAFGVVSKMADEVPELRSPPTFASRAAMRHARDTRGGSQHP